MIRITAGIPTPPTAGTLFLDEKSGDMPCCLQAQAFCGNCRRVNCGRWQQRNAQRLTLRRGDRHPSQFCVNRCKSRSVREDLFYRADALPHPSAALRERAKDILPVGPRKFVGSACLFSTRSLSLVRTARLEQLAIMISWNVRELKGLIRPRAAALPIGKPAAGRTLQSAGRYAGFFERSVGALRDSAWSVWSATC